MTLPTRTAIFLNGYEAAPTEPEIIIALIYSYKQGAPTELNKNMKNRRFYKKMNVA